MVRLNQPDVDPTPEQDMSETCTLEGTEDRVRDILKLTTSRDR